MSRRRGTRGRSAAPEPKQQILPVRLMLTLGAVAAAIGSVLALVPAVSSLFAGDPEPSATLAVTSARPMRYEQYLRLARRSTVGHEQDLAVRGAAINYDVVTEHLAEGAEVPIHLEVLNDSDPAEAPRTIVATPLTVSGPRRCGCVDFVPAQQPGDEYVVTVVVLPPGAGDGDQALDRRDVTFRQRQLALAAPARRSAPRGP
jgi:hypothetical protein